MFSPKSERCSTSENERIRPLKRDYFNRKCMFQPLIFRGHVSFPGNATTDYSNNQLQKSSFRTPEKKSIEDDVSPETELARN